MENEAKANVMKRCKNAYIIYTMERRKALKILYPNMNSKDLVKLIAEEWKNLSMQEKEFYKEKEIKERESYDKNKLNSKVGVKYKRKPLKKPLRFRTPFMFYLMDVKGTLKDISVSQTIERLREIGAKWRVMSHDEKKIYIEKSKFDKERYVKDFEAYVNNNLIYNKESSKRKSNKIEKLLNNVKANIKDCKFLKKINDKCQYIKRLKKNIKKETMENREMNQLSENQINKDCKYHPDEYVNNRQNQQDSKVMIKKNIETKIDFEDFPNLNKITENLFKIVKDYHRQQDRNEETFDVNNFANYYKYSNYSNVKNDSLKDVKIEIEEYKFSDDFMAQYPSKYDSEEEAYYSNAYTYNDMN